MPQELPHRVDERGAVGGDLAVADAMHEAQRREVERAQAGHLDEAAVGEDHEGGDALGAGDRAAHRAQVLEQRLVGRREAGGGAVDEQAAFPAPCPLPPQAPLGLGPEPHPLAAEQDRLAFFG